MGERLPVLPVADVPAAAAQRGDRDGGRAHPAARPPGAAERDRPADHPRSPRPRPLQQLRRYDYDYSFSAQRAAQDSLSTSQLQNSVLAGGTPGRPVAGALPAALAQYAAVRGRAGPGPGPAHPGEPGGPGDRPPRPGTPPLPPPPPAPPPPAPCPPPPAAPPPAPPLPCPPPSLRAAARGRPAWQALQVFTDLASRSRRPGPPAWPRPRPAPPPRPRPSPRCPGPRPATSCAAARSPPASRPCTCGPTATPRPCTPATSSWGCAATCGRGRSDGAPGRKYAGRRQVTFTRLALPPTPPADPPCPARRRRVRPARTGPRRRHHPEHLGRGDDHPQRQPAGRPRPTRRSSTRCRTSRRPPPAVPLISWTGRST